jgi:hypothetical protein
MPFLIAVEDNWISVLTKNGIAEIIWVSVSVLLFNHNHITPMYTKFKFSIENAIKKFVISIIGFFIIFHILRSHIIVLDFKSVPDIWTDKIASKLNFNEFLLPDLLFPHCPKVV